MLSFFIVRRGARERCGHLCGGGGVRERERERWLRRRPLLPRLGERERDFRDDERE